MDPPITTFSFHESLGKGLSVSIWSSRQNLCRSSTNWMNAKNLAKLKDKIPGPVEGLPELTLEGIAEYVKSGKAKHVVICQGAGISCAAGIPDFRTPGTGLYSQLEKYKLPYPEAIFTLDYFDKRPEPFFLLNKELILLMICLPVLLLNVW